MEMPSGPPATLAGDARTSLVLDALPLLVVAVDEAGRVVMFNAAAEASTGRRRADVLGRPADVGLRPQAWRTALPAAAGTVVGPQTTQWTTPSGQARVIEWRGFVVGEGAGRLFVQLGEDVAARRRAEAGLRERVIEITRAITASLDADAVLERIVEQAGELLQAPRVALAVVEPDEAGPVLRFVAARGLSARFAERVRPAHWRDGTTSMAIHERRPVSSADVLNDPAIDLTPATRHGVEAEGYRAVLSVPLLAADRALGALVLYRDEPGPFAPDVIQLLQVFAAQAAVAIENARLYRRSENRAAKLRALSALSQLIVSAAASGTVFQAVAEAAIELLGAGLVRVWVVDSDRRTMRVVGSAGDQPAADAGHTLVGELPYGSGIVGAAVVDRQPVYGRDVQSDARWEGKEQAAALGLHAFATLPLVTADHAVGALVLVFLQRRDFTAEEQEIMRLLADHAAIAIQQAQLYQEADRRRDEAEVMAELGRQINASLELDVVLGRVVQGARDLCRADFGRIAVRTPDDPTVRFRHWIGNRYERWGDVVLEPGKGIGGRVLTTGVAFRTDDYATDPRFSSDYRDLARAEGTIAEMAVPVRSDAEVHGVVYVSNRSARRFTDHDEAIVRRLADYAGAAIKNANLYQGLRTAHEQLARSQVHLVQSERLRALGEMAAGVAHDFNNVLAVILGRTELLLTRATDPLTVRGLSEVRRAATDGAATVRRIQNFTGTRRARRAGRVMLGDVARDVVELTTVRWKDEAQRRGVHYEVSATGQAPAVAGHSDELREVFTNLVNNALDAMPGGGRCTLRVGVEDTWATVEIEDTGEGMSDVVRARLFEPFFTTKGPHGTGLGLAVSWGIVNACGGTITVDSAPGAGSRFTVRIPVAHTVATDAPATEAAPAPRYGRILVIDDDETVREVLSDMLQDSGHTVVQAESGVAALAACAAAPVDLVITDLSMPGMSGWDVAAAFARDYPGLPVGMVTGWGDQVDPEQAARHLLRFVLNKPFELNDVLRAVADAIAGGDARSAEGADHEG